MFINYWYMPRELEARCQVVAHKRQQEADRLNRHGHNNAPATGPLALQYHGIGIRAEAVAWDWLGRLPKWNELASAIKGLPDLEIGDLKIDAKGVDDPNLSLIVQLDDPEEWVYLLVAREAPTHWYQIQGWMWGHEAKVFPVVSLQAKRPAHVIRGQDKVKLRGPAELAWMVSGRREDVATASRCNHVTDGNVN